MGAIKVTVLETAPKGIVVVGAATVFKNLKDKPQSLSTTSGFIVDNSDTY